VNFLRFFLLAALLATLTPSGSAARPHAASWTPGVRAAIAYASQRRGEIAFAGRTRSGAWGWRKAVPFRSASVVKAMLLAAYLNKRLLVVDAYSTFTDGSGRANYFQRDHLYLP